jgi:HK97 family phage prohead protease
MERRAAQLEVRASRKERRLEGYAAVFNCDAHIQDFVERIAPGAFASSLHGKGDILALLDHNPAALLARTKSETLRLAEDKTGLHFDLSLPDTSHGRDVLTLAERGDLGGMSFGFTVDDDGEHWDGNRRELRCVTLHEISVVSSWPAYPQTSVTARSMCPFNRRMFRVALGRRWIDLVK